MMPDSNLDALLHRIRNNGNRLAVLEARTSNPEILRRVKDAEGWNVELKRELSENDRTLTSKVASARVGWQLELTATLIADVEREVMHLR